MNLSELIEGIGIRERHGFREVGISSLSTDSRSVDKGTLFIAVKGYTVNGHDFIAKAVEAGASAVVAECSVDLPVPVIVVDDASSSVSLLAKRFYGDPASKMFVAGITGTNGKTSTSFLLRSILEAEKGRSGIIGTLGFGSSEKTVSTGHTTPDSNMLFRILDDFVKEGCSSAVMEVSSHSVVQGRIEGIEFDTGIFTNITRDHLDYHETLEKYVAAKEAFARTLVSSGRTKPAGALVYNSDDRYVNEIGERFSGRKISFGFSSDAMVRAESLQADLDGTRFSLVTENGSIGIGLRLHGRFSAYNALGAAGAALTAGVSLKGIKEGLEKVSSVPGRFQVLRTIGGPMVVIDYAHTPDALKNLLGFCRELGAQRVVTIFGCGGDRDRGKRPMMGSIAAELSDKICITSDNPRSEDPGRIIEDILEGTRDSKTETDVVVDRADAIRKTISGSSKGDLIVIAGKGHEDYQILSTGKIDFSDFEEAEKNLMAMEEKD
ncbi:MAG: UDP-N-acetylmuramoyl-L-alanyl-D-glutamate--2,6-diaminopimelate ligase [Candidatus Krumholzibacteriota bacterium]|nr:UDP-N-acetylmuramoyl-L-alanyl-D-glutamate--2,6-diaminopimelate ligase [Candidatus Krumholzibacteriota bacterium]